MISHLSHTSIFVLDQDSAKAFYTETLGFDVRVDITMGEDFEGAGAGFRWLTVGAQGQPDLQLILSSCDMGRSPEAAVQLRQLVASGAMGVGVMATDDCHRTYQELSAKGVTFLSEPTERPYGIEATMRDDSGNLISLTQAFAFEAPRADHVILGTGLGPRARQGGRYVRSSSSMRMALPRSTSYMTSGLCPLSIFSAYSFECGQVVSVWG